MENNHPTLGNGKICYIEIPAIDIDSAASFYKKTFGWSIRQRGDDFWDTFFALYTAQKSGNSCLTVQELPRIVENKNYPKKIFF